MVHIILEFEHPTCVTSPGRWPVQDSPGRADHSCAQEDSTSQTATVSVSGSFHRELHCFQSDVITYSDRAVGNNLTLRDRILGAIPGTPVTSGMPGVLHVLITKPSESIAHYAFDAVGQGAKISFASKTFRQRLYVVHVHDGTLYYAIWTQGPKLDQAVWTSKDSSSHSRSFTHCGMWTTPSQVSDTREVLGVPTLYVDEDTLHVRYRTQNSQISDFVYSQVFDVWASCDVSQSKAVKESSAISYGESVLLVCREDGPRYASHTRATAEDRHCRMIPHRPIVGRDNSDPAQLAALDDRINCDFNFGCHKLYPRYDPRPLLSFSLSSWMSTIPDETPLSNITIPGTHDSCARTDFPFVRTQYLNVAEQLTAGIRFLDLRLRLHSDGQLFCYHGGIPANWPFNLSFDTVMQEVFLFMSALRGPTETILVAIMDDEGIDHAGFYRAFNRAIAAQSKKWIVSPNTVTLGQARGKAVLLRRFAPPSLAPSDLPIGLDLYNWRSNNPAFTLHTNTGIAVTIQDKWQYTDRMPLSALIDSKFAYVAAMLDTASADTDVWHWYLNFSSAVGDPRQHGELAESRWIAVGARSEGFGGEYVKGVNVRLRDDYKGWGAGKKRLGVVAMDYPDLPKNSDLITRLVKMNL